MTFRYLAHRLLICTIALTALIPALRKKLDTQGNIPPAGNTQTSELGQ